MRNIKYENERISLRTFRKIKKNFETQKTARQFTVLVYWSKIFQNKLFDSYSIFSKNF